MLLAAPQTWACLSTPEDESAAAKQENEDDDNRIEDLLLELRGVLEFHLKRIAAIQKQVDVLIEQRRVRSPD